MPDLDLPTYDVHASFLGAVAEYRAEGCFPEFDQLDVQNPDAFAAYVDQLRDDPRVLYQPGLPPLTILWWTEGEHYLGRLSIWHRLHPDWAHSGYIGYDVRPTARRRGHATAMLAAAMPTVHALGIDPVLVTVRAHNTASRRVIEANGGQLVQQDGDRLRFHLPAARSA
ncbi:GNAT family N-acetyltransferase [Kitasatospora sp. HPMI-4]|uniref:GNAT family N-acetyltransferase n=1 Tax=Kitasatospora sp. HPMI-4 TaxID=3448443 RepID=UPI003F1CED88